MFSIMLVLYTDSCTKVQIALCAKYTCICNLDQYLDNILCLHYKKIRVILLDNYTVMEKVNKAFLLWHSIFVCTYVHVCMYICM